MIEAGKVLVAVVTAVSTALVMYVLGWVRTWMAQRLKLSSPVERRIKSLESFATQQSEMLDSIMDRQANVSKGLITLANAVKTGDQSKVNEVLDMMAKSEDQYIKFLRSRTKPIQAGNV
jgi:flagellar hook-basal body complex protein FliE